MRVKVSEMNGDMLDKAVAILSGVMDKHGRYTDEFCDSLPADDDGLWSESWRLTGPIIHREKMDVIHRAGVGWIANVIANGECISCVGPTPLIAALRTYVILRAGPEVELPDREKS